MLETILSIDPLNLGMCLPSVMFEMPTRLFLFPNGLVGGGLAGVECWNKYFPRAPCLLLL